MSVIFTQRSQSDLGDILEFHVLRDPLHANRLTDLPVDASLSLDRFPDRGSAARGQSARTYRRIFESGHVIVYAVVDDDVVIVRVLHGSRDVDAILSEEL